MKKHLFILFILVPNVKLFAQLVIPQDTTFKSISNHKNISESSNSNDVFTNFMQVAIQDISGTNKGFQFKGNLFAFNSNDNKYLSKNYLSCGSTFLRHTEIQIGGGMNSSSSLDSLKLGINYTIINNQDLTTIPNTTPVQENFNFLLRTTKNTYIENSNLKLKSEGKGDEFIEKADSIFNDHLKSLYSSKNDSVLKTTEPAFVQYMDSVLNNSSMFNGLDLTQSMRMVIKSFKDFDKLIARKGIVTFNPAIIYNPISKNISSVGPAAEWTTGVFTRNDVTKNLIELDISSNYSFGYDSLAPPRTGLKRRVYDGQAGLNKVWLVDTAQSPMLETKLGYELLNVFDGLYKNERTTTATIDLTLQVHSGNSPVIKIIIKGGNSIKNPNFLGFLNVSWNLDSGGSSSSSANNNSSSKPPKTN